MYLPFIATPLLLALLGASPEAPAHAPAAATQTCYYEPSGTVHIETGAVQTFATNEFTGCSGLTITISPANGVAGFSSGTACSRTQVTTGTTGIFKVRGCSAGQVTVTVSSGSTVLQTITVYVGQPVAE